MAELLKDKYLHKGFFKQLSSDLKQVYPALNERKFYNDCIKPLDQLELMQRITHLTETSARHLPDDFPQALSVLYQLSAIIDDKLGYLFLSEFVSSYGQKHYELAIKALRDFTHHSSSEFAIRHFLQNDFDKTLKNVNTWTRNKSEHIRRLASEGTRPRLPWSQKLPQIIQSPELSWSILDALKTDPSTYVQKSVANHINDISKDNPEWIVKKLKKWDQKNPVTAWIIKHGLRTLIKKGHPGALALQNVKPAKIKMTRFLIEPETIKTGDSVNLVLRFASTSSQAQKVIIDYRLYYPTKTGKINSKVFKLKTMLLAADEKLSLTKVISFKPLSTRKYHSGNYSLEILVNGNALKKKRFTLTN